ncbi:flagellar basal body-associated FliL family protein [Novosphingobium sp. JCM 18896]|uniref:flagellar basal body-associated FliL family protein n=1 Tax=Novosphingobium sp. JCM 18896 TaxID=2989731 RepID=UPI00222219D2|nr:flagellar basal body-associated FliL family protein [Novosphingobium sp. JCM 18896]MCW1429360.1 flagellar basal body-associated FliL family protein [Novosphingobium sp. JCM 18896]
MNSKRIVLGAVAGIAIMGAGAAGAIWMQRDGVADAVESDAKVAVKDVASLPDDAVAQSQPLYYSFDKPFTANLKYNADMIQVEVALSSRFATTIDALKTDSPALRSVVLDVLSSASEETAMSDAGKHQLEAAIAAAINKQLQSDGYAGGVDAAYFTSFVAQPNDG